MTDRQLRGGQTDLSPDQRAVFDAHFEESGVVCTPAGSGTGKTTTAVETVAEAVVRELHRDPGRNPFESILVTTFTKDAARQLKAELKARLREHRRAAPADDPVVERWDDLLRWLETASHVRTIDSFTQELLREVALEVGVAPSFGVADGIRRSDLLEDVFSALRADPDLEGPIERLEETFPTDADGRDDWESMVESIHRSCREFCLPVEEARRQLLVAVTEMHAGREPTDFGDVLAIVDALADYDPEYVETTVEDPEAWVEHARETYRSSRRLAGDFGVVLSAFAERYDRTSRDRGVLTHTDITYVVREYLEGDPPVARAGDGDADRRRERFRESLAGRFEHVVVDEFQDTNYAQCRILAHLVDGADALLIGDLKQSIYEWRSAEPRLFADLIAYADGDAEDNVLDADSVRTVPLTENFRSHPHLVRAANYLFPKVFSDPGRGGIGTFDVEYDPLTARRVETEPDEPHVHALRVEDPDSAEDRSRRELRAEAEAERVAATLRHALDEGSLRVDRERQLRSRTEDDPEVDADPTLDPIRAGDVALLFRTKRYVRLYSRVLDRYGIDNAVIGTHSLFDEPEIEALVDALAWVGRPEDPARVRRLVESGLVALSPAGLDELAAAGHDVDRAVERWDGDPTDLAELRALTDLREQLRHRRAGPKARLVTELLIHSAFDVAALAEGVQRYANVRRFVEVIEGWEEEEPLSYAEFLRRLERLRRGRIDDDTTLADVADMDSPETAKLLTAHTAKGLEFPVVVLADTAHDEAHLRVCDEAYVADRRHGLAIRPTTGGHEQPDDESVPAFSGGWFHEDDSGFDRDRGLLWLSEHRGSDGRIRHDHPFRGYVRDRRAEFWRLLYVAATRACDHLVVPFVDGRVGEWTTWAGALAEYLDPDGTALETDDGPVPVGVDDLSPADPPDGTAVDPVELLGDDGTGADAVESSGRPRDRRFRPASVSATGLRTLLDDPPAYQRSVLRGIGTATGLHREDAGLPVDRVREGGTDPPADLSPDAWGTVVHGVLESIHRSVAAGQADDDGGSARARSANAPDPSAVVDPERVVRDALGTGAGVDTATDRVAESVLPAYRSTDTWADLREGAELFPEFEVLAPVPDVDGSLLRGRIDLLYRREGWHVVDFKTGPAAEGPRLRAYRTQLSAYAWLLWSVYGIEPSARLVYLPAGEERTVDVDPVAFASDLASLDGLYVDDGVLRRTE